MSPHPATIEPDRPAEFTDMRPTGQVAVVTGAASGIGAAVVHRLLARGMTVIGCDVVSMPSTGAVHQQLHPRRLDVSDSRAVRATVHAVLGRWGRVDVLANVAGIHDGFSAAHSMTDELWDRVLDVDLTGPLRMARAVLPSMIERRSGSIVNVASVAGLSGSISGAAYTAAKHGLIGLTRSIASMYRQYDIRCNAVCPGSVTTRLAEGDAVRDPWGFEHLRGRLSRPERQARADEIASLVAYLASEEASFVSGSIVGADGAWLA
ncbi:SDR family oxidoreductase [Nakamurella sp. YIM 132087]|uniref:SDR family oxidoreductase n=1 Tax=Nakamurella alba TaxID=2665158 RepID=A0A7K1FEM5_9ACTN|nr:SDR family NAD(P)-dependent oxidoreductase [Nakamurella alba]MTD12551.1 SDR family oxidoreductase [Nakamurella alba]